ncbi:MAG: hypothetical protein JWQ74_459 [Marmoricola sp.]|nr:hypothetical protein [Marmoricola sp.]
MRIKRSTAAIAATALVAVGLGASSASADTNDHAVRASDFVTALSDTRANGHVDFLKEGVHLTTDTSGDAASTTGNLSKAAEYFAVNKPLAGVTDVQYDWYGTTPSPGTQYIVDFDGNGDADGTLVGEKVYGGQDVWLTNGSKAAYKDEGAPSNEGGSGSANHGTLAAWSAKYPAAKILYAGFSLGSGVNGDGVLRSITLGEDRYVFTDEAAVVVPDAPTTKAVTADGSFINVDHIARFRMSSDALPVNDTAKGAKVRWEIKVDGISRYLSYNGWGDSARWSWKFANKTGIHNVQVIKNGVNFKTTSINTNK